MAIKSNKKGLFMTILILILFLLILGELITFALLNSNYNSLDQAAAIGSGSINYGKSIQISSLVFANASLTSALSVLANYELNASIRKGNLISNTSQYLTYLIVNGTLPNIIPNSIPANYLAKNMGGLTLSAYNSSLQNLFSLGAISLTVNQSKPVIFQTSPYTLTVSYVENVALNSTSGKFRYQIPVNATISLNSTPDLFFYQQGTAQNIKFSQTTNLTAQIGLINATNGNFVGTIYGPVYSVPTGTGGLTCSSLSTMISANVPAFSFAPYNQMLILATSNAIGITNGGAGPNCINQYGGLITYSINSISSPPSIPWLLYPSATNLLNNIRTGQHVLILGNTLSSYSIQNFVNAAGVSSYFGSPFSPSYLDRAQSGVLKQNPNGIFSLSPYNLQVGYFNGATSNILEANALVSNSATQFTVSAWIYSNSLPTLTAGIAEEGCGSLPQVWCFHMTGGLLAFGNAGCGNINSGTVSYPFKANTWYNVVGTWVSGGLAYLYVNGNQIVSGSFTLCQNSPQFEIGSEGGSGAFPGSIANVQVYNQSLSGAQVSQLYQQGISAIPPSNSGLIGWWPLDGNANDYSGQGNTGTRISVPYVIPANYQRDSIVSAVVPTYLSPTPGLLFCNNNVQCSNTLLPHTYIGYMPLGLQQNFFQVASFNSYGLVQISSATPLNPTAGITISGWVYWPVSAVKEMIVKNNNANTGPGAYEFFQSSQSIAFRLYKSGVGTTIASANTLSLNAWHYVTATWDGTNMKMYIDGVQDANTGSLSGPIDTTTGALTVGAYDNLLFPYVGSISNLQIYDGALSANQVTQLYKEGILGVPLRPTTANVLGWWPLNGNANDYSGYSNNGMNSNVIYTSFTGSYNGPGLSSITTSANEWQVIGIPRSGG